VSHAIVVVYDVEAGAFIPIVVVYDVEAGAFVPIIVVVYDVEAGAFVPFQILLWLMSAAVDHTRTIRGYIIVQQKVTVFPK
jgi:hypothetical protein